MPGALLTAVLSALIFDGWSGKAARLPAVLRAPPLGLDQKEAQESCANRGPCKARNCAQIGGSGSVEKMSEDFLRISL